MNKRNYKNLHAENFDAFDSIHSDLANAFCHIDNVIGAAEWHTNIFSKADLAVLENMAKRIRKFTNVTFDAQTEMNEAGIDAQQSIEDAAEDAAF
tara:strand:+ start:186 stop:470 length:285 start_codon:yes stop_codon:yes gene_type:complete